MALDYLFIVNPAAGNRNARGMIKPIIELMQHNRLKTEVVETRARGDARRLAAEAAANGVLKVIGCGGDGTLQEIATGLEGSETALGILPGGRCNDFARALGYPPMDSFSRYTHAMMTGRRIRVDLGAFTDVRGEQVGEKRFLTVATMGFDSEVSRFVENRKLPFKGTAAYVYAVLRVLASYKRPLVKLTLTGGEENFEGRVLLAATGNAPCYGGNMWIAPGAKLDDGLFQLCVVKDVSALTVLRILPRVFRGTHITHPAVKMLNGSAVEIETPEGPQWVCADGETLGQTPCKLEIRRSALTVLAP